MFKKAGDLLGEFYSDTKNWNSGLSPDHGLLVFCLFVFFTPKI